MEDNHCVIKDLHPSNQLMTKIPMTSNRLFPLKMIPYIKGKENSGVAFKTQYKEAAKHCNKEEKETTKIQVSFQS